MARLRNNSPMYLVIIVVFFTVSITANGEPIFLEGIAVFNVVNRSSSAYTVQA